MAGHRALTLVATAPLWSAPILVAKPAAAEPIISVGFRLSFELGDNPGSSFGLDIRAAGSWGTNCGENVGALGALIAFDYIPAGGVRLMLGADYAEDEGELGSGAQLGWFLRSESRIGRSAHGLFAGAFLRTERIVELGANAMFTFADFDPSMNAWFGLRASSNSLCVEGRPLKVDGDHAPVLCYFNSNHVAAAPDSTLAAHWRRAARAERASVTTFVELAQDLTSLGAPDALVRAAKSAARDEHRHAALAESLASHFGPTFATQAPSLPRRRNETPTQRLSRLAKEALTDGLFNESLASRDAEVAAQTCRHQPTRDALRIIARDERNHADLAAATLAFVLDQAPQLRAYVHEAQLPELHASSTRPAHRPEDGLLGDKFHLEVAQDEAANVARRVHAIL